MPKHWQTKEPRATSADDVNQAMRRITKDESHVLTDWGRITQRDLNILSMAFSDAEAAIQELQPTEDARVVSDDGNVL